MNQLKVFFVLVLALFVCLARGSGWGGPEQGFGGRGLGRGGEQGGQGGGEGRRGRQGGFDQGFDGLQGPNGRQSNGHDSNKYRSNLYSDDDVYGYDATYPNGEAAYINYKSKDARARRGPEFARTSRAYSRQGGGGGGGERNSGFGQANEFKGKGAGMW